MASTGPSYSGDGFSIQYRLVVINIRHVLGGVLCGVVFTVKSVGKVHIFLKFGAKSLNTFATDRLAAVSSASSPTEAQLFPRTLKRTCRSS